MFQTYGRIIISEMHLPPSQKTIRPVKIGGVAGGLYKYVCQGILFKVHFKLNQIPLNLMVVLKFAVDNVLDIGRNFWMYGGTEPATEFAMVAAKNELRGTFSTHSYTNVPNIIILNSCDQSLQL